MSKNLSRRTFVAGSAAAAVSAGLVGLAGCSSSSTTTTESSLPAESDYPLDPDGDDVEALWTSETLRKDGWTKVTNPDDGPTIGVMDTAKIIQVDGLAFRDMDGDGKLEFWEDWRQPVEDRARVFANSLSADQILPLMWCDGFQSTSAPLDDAAKETISKGLRSGVSRAQAAPDNYVEAINWINAVQEECEKSELGIPYLNFTDQYQNFDIPDNCGIAASMDAELFQEAARRQGKTWRATGVRGLLGPQIDICTNPVWSRYSGSISEDPALNRDFAKSFITGLQSTFDDDGNDLGWGTDSVLGMPKHYCGAGAAEGGRNDHNDEGKFNVFPGDNYKAHFIPFFDGALNLGSETGACASIMPNYGIAYSEDLEYGENVGGGFSSVRTGYLRNLGWDGMVTTDWVVTLDNNEGAGGTALRDWGVEELSEDERELKGIKAGDDQFGGEFTPSVIEKAYASLEDEIGEDEALTRIRESARRIFTCMLNVDLFENPYSDREEAAAIFEDESYTDFGVEAAEKSMIMLKNAGNVINENGLGDKPTVYIPQILSGGGMFSSTPATFGLPVDEEAAAEYFNVITDTVGEPTGTSTNIFTGEVTTGVYQDSDAVMPSDDELAKCDYAVVIISCPTAEGGVTENEDGTKTYTPASLQYRPYTADGDYVRTESLAGNKVESEKGAIWDSTTGGTKENRSYFGQSVTASNESDLDKVIELREKLPESAKLIVVVEAVRPMCFYELEPYCDVILMQFMMEQGINGGALLNILTGQAEPSALLPAQMPLDMDEVEKQDEDVPRDMKCYTDSEGNTYDFCFGLNWSGVISDERTETYGVDPLTEPEAEFIES